MRISEAVAISCILQLQQSVASSHDVEVRSGTAAELIQQVSGLLLRLLPLLCEDKETARFVSVSLC